MTYLSTVCIDVHVQKQIDSIEYISNLEFGWQFQAFVNLCTSHLKFRIYLSPKVNNMVATNQDHLLLFVQVHLEL